MVGLAGSLSLSFFASYFDEGCSLACGKGYCLSEDRLGPMIEATTEVSSGVLIASTVDFSTAV